MTRSQFSWGATLLFGQVAAAAAAAVAASLKLRHAQGGAAKEILREGGSTQQLEGAGCACARACSCSIHAQACCAVLRCAGFGPHPLRPLPLATGIHPAPLPAAPPLLCSPCDRLPAVSSSAATPSLVRAFSTQRVCSPGSTEPQQPWARAETPCTYHCFTGWNNSLDGSC